MASISLLRGAFPPASISWQDVRHDDLQQTQKQGTSWPIRQFDASDSRRFQSGDGIDRSPSA